MDKYEFGQCNICGKEKPLKNRTCLECKDKVDLPDFMKEIFGGFKDEKSN